MILFVVLALYLLPSVLAWYRGAPNLWSVVAIDVLLGWTVVGWVVALAMAVRDVSPRSDR